MSRLAKGEISKPGAEMHRVCVYLPADDVKKLKIKLLQETETSNVSDWVRKQIVAFLKTKN